MITVKTIRMNPVFLNQKLTNLLSNTIIIVYKSLRFLNIVEVINMKKR